VTEATKQNQRGLSLGQAVSLGLLVWGGALWAALAVADNRWRAGLTCGVVTGGLGGAVGFGLMHPTLGKPNKSVISAMSLAFLARMVLVAAGLVVTGRTLQGEPLGFALAFFPLFFIFAALELLMVVRYAPPPDLQPAPSVPTEES